MSTAMAIASVTYVLKNLLNNFLVSSAAGMNVNITALAPDLINLTESGQSQLNLFLYRVSHNQGWSNMNLPSRSGRGEIVNNQPLALDLHYLLTAYCTNELHSEMLLGLGIQMLHETPVLGRETIRNTLSNVSQELQILSMSNLADQIEQIKMTFESLTTEEISKLWAALQTNYRPSAAYQATVVLIESEKSAKPPLPVREINYYIPPLRNPVIERIMSQSGGDNPIVENQYILAGYNLVIQGKNLIDDEVKINIDGIEITKNEFIKYNNTEIIFPLPEHLPAGVHGIKIIHPKFRGIGSNLKSFVLSPSIELLSVGDKHEINGNNISATINLKVKPDVHEKQKIVLLLNEIQTVNSDGDDTESPASYSFNINLSDTPTDTISLEVENIKKALYLVRIQVDGAESPLEFTEQEGKYYSPSIDLTAV